MCKHHVIQSVEDVRVVVRARELAVEMLKEHTKLYDADTAIGFNKEEQMRWVFPVVVGGGGRGEASCVGLSLSGL